MRKFIRSNGIWTIVLALVLTAVLSVLSVFVPALTEPAGGLMHILGTPFRAVSSAFADRVEAVYDYAFRYQMLQDRVEELEAEVAEMAEENRVAEDALEENERLRELLNLRESRNDLTLESARITAWSANSWESSMTISKGTSSGIQVDMCVINENGYLVGIVTEAGPNWATVATLIDPEVTLGAKIERTDESAVLSSSLAYMNEGICSLSYVDMEADIVEGDTVLTSGLGGIYPAGLVIGTVTSAGTDLSGMERSILIQPAVYLDELQQVFVVKDFEVVE